MGTSVQQQQLAATAAGSLYAATGGGGLSGAPFSSAASAPLPAGPGGEQQSNLLRALSGKWKGKVGGL